MFVGGNIYWSFFDCGLTGCPGSIPTHRGGPEESEGGCGNEEPADTPTGEEDL